MYVKPSHFSHLSFACGFSQKLTGWYPGKEWRKREWVNIQTSTITVQYLVITYQQSTWYNIDSLSVLSSQCNSVQWKGGQISVGEPETKDEVWRSEVLFGAEAHIHLYTYICKGIKNFGTYGCEGQWGRQGTENNSKCFHPPPPGPKTPAYRCWLPNDNTYNSTETTLYLLSDL